MFASLLRLDAADFSMRRCFDVANALISCVTILVKLLNIIR